MARYVVAGVVGSALIVPVELIALGVVSLDIVWTVTSLLLTLGLVVGAVIAAAEWTIKRFELGHISAAAVRGATTMPAFSFVARRLFDGGYAATLPGANTAVYWLPLIGAGVVGGASLVIRVLLNKATSARLAWLLSGALIVAVIVFEYANRTLFRSGYRDVHAFLLLASVVLATVFVHVTSTLVSKVDRRLTPNRRLHRITYGGAAALVISFTCALSFGLDNKQSRWTIATQGNHARQMTRLLRAAIDFDGDGYAAVLGGGDCNDTDATINPGADDTPQNGIDEDCDGADAEPLPEQLSDDSRRSHATTVAEWLSTAPVQRTLSQTSGYHMVVIMIDTLRADLLTDTPANRADFPNMFALKNESRHYTRAFAPASGTDMAIPAILTGEIDPFKLIRKTLIEAFTNAGIRTHAVLPNEVLRWAGKTLLTRGLGSYDRIVNDRVRRDYGSHTTSVETTRRGLAYVDKHIATNNTQRFWLWLHYFDVHEHAEIKASDKQLRRVLGGKRASGKVAKYRATAKLVDEQVGTLRRELTKRKLWSKTIVVLVSDHGEGLGEDKRLPETHGKFLYNALVHVPLMIRVPGQRPGPSGRAVPLIDLTPTLMGLAGLTVPQEMDGHSLLVDLLDGAPKALTAVPRPILLNESDQHGIILWPHKLLIRPAENLVELYDLERDFGETNDLSDRNPARVRQLKQLYKSFPSVTVDRSRKARERREKLALPP